MQVHECEGCVHRLIIYTVDGAVRAARCLMRRSTRPGVPEDSRAGVRLEEVAQCPDRARAARRAGAV